MEDRRLGRPRATGLCALGNALTRKTSIQAVEYALAQSITLNSTTSIEPAHAVTHQMDGTALWQEACNLIVQFRRAFLDGASLGHQPYVELVAVGAEERIDRQS